MTALALLLKYWQAGLLVALLGVGAVGWHEYRNALIDKGIAQEQTRVAKARLDTLEHQAAKIDTIFRRDTVTLVKRIASTTVLRDTLLQHLTDTIRVKEFIAASDSALHACTEVVSSCAASLKVKDQQIATLQQLIHAIPNVEVSRRWYSDRLACGPSAGIDQHAKGTVGASCVLALFRGP